MAAGYLVTELDQHIAGPDLAPPTSTLEIIVLILHNTYDPGGNVRMVSKDSNTTEREYRFMYNDGGFRYQASTDGTNYSTVNTSADHPVVGGNHLWGRVVHDLTTGDVNFYYSEDPIETAHDAVSWTQLGTTQSSTTSISNEPSLIRVGGENSGDPIDRTYGAWIIHDGTLVASPDARDDDQGWSSPPGTDSQANSWSLVNGATWVAPTGPAFPDAPENLAATPVSTSQIDLSWDALDGADAYDIERDGVIIETDHATNSYSDTGLDPSTEYDYRVRGKTTA